jgi:hypothetical protein
MFQLRHNRYLSFSERLIGPFPEKLDKLVDNSLFSDKDPAFDAFARGKLIRLSVTAGERCCRDCGYRCARPDLQDYLWRCENYGRQRSDKKGGGTFRISLGEDTLRPIDDWRTKARAIMARARDGVDRPTAERDAQKTSPKYLSKQCNCSYN